MSTRGPGPPDSTLEDRVRTRLQGFGALEPGERLVVGVSGGLDSLALLHLLRFAWSGPVIEPIAAHFDHAMRPGSAADASWVRGLACAWELPFATARAREVPRGEAEAREARYAFLADVRRARGARWILTAHHADDQAETVLFRIVRGTGLEGLRGIRDRPEEGILRPLLTTTRAELAAYARSTGLRPRPDPTNLSGLYARNVLRHEVIPRVEEAVAPDAREALRRLARHADREVEAWGAALPLVLREIGFRESSGEKAGLEFEREPFLALPDGLRARILRSLLRRVGVVPDEAATLFALDFTSGGASGGRIDLPVGGWIEIALDRVRLGRGTPGRGPEGPRRADDVTLSIPAGSTGDGTLRIGDRCWSVRWGPRPHPHGRWRTEVRITPAEGPLEVRGWLPGDRIRTHAGTRKLKKVFLEARLEVGERRVRPVVVDRRGRVRWVPGVAEEAPSADERDSDSEELQVVHLAVDPIDSTGPA